MESNWLVFIFGLVVGLYIKAWIHEFTIKFAIRFLDKHGNTKDAIKNLKDNQVKSKFQQRLEDLKKAQETKQPK